MSMSDPIADMLTRIRNALAVRKRTVKIPASNMKQSIATVLKQEGYISGVETQKDGAHQNMTITLRYADGVGAIEEIQRVSRPGRRVYCNAEDLPRVNGGLGIVMVSTSKGLMTDREARSSGVGGEVVCRVF
ncbi:MAG: 30S ribosomal protein S8 [Arenicellales bacterium]|jgi:small subunit ribosomal protein S8|nr:MAG: 30S ribosomal protein S8 [Proteobacteria bacterium TMED61]RZO15982.1 MAG: 30S ribosomal protein S8 [Candidatus Thioglobus sp.]